MDTDTHTFLLFRTIPSLRRCYRSLFLIFSLMLGACGGDGNPAVTSPDSDTMARQLVVSEVVIDDEEESLTISGLNFDSGAWPLAEVTLNDTSLEVVQQSGDEIIVNLPSGFELDGVFLLTVKAGDESENLDSFLLVPLDADPASLFTQLAITTVESSGEAGQMKLYVIGHNFDNGTWPPEVSYNDVPLVVDSNESNGQLLVILLTEAQALALSDPSEDLVLIIKTGSANENSDAYSLPGNIHQQEVVPPIVTIPPGIPQPEPPTLACKREDLVKVPIAGEWCCTTAGQDLCWSTGPIREDTKMLGFNSDTIPRYFELTQDYVMPIADYFNNPPPVPFPSFWRVAGDGDPDTKREKLKPLVDDLPEVFEQVAELVHSRKWDFAEYADGKLIIKKGYRWDGASVGWDRKYFDDRLLRTYLINMRSSLVHDVFYDLIRLKIMSSDTTDNAPLFGGTNDYRNVADILFYLTAREDGQKDNGFKTCALGCRKGKLQTFFKTLRRLGQTKARLHSEKDAAWRFHTLADAAVSASDTEMEISDKGFKSIVLSCDIDGGNIILDAGKSHPIAKKPIPGHYDDHLDLHDSSWLWSIEGKIIRQGIHDSSTGNLFAYPDALKTATSIDELLGLGISVGKKYPLTLYIDKGKDTPNAIFESIESVTLSIEDREGPRISGIIQPISSWPPNHKYRNFTIADFVYSVSDDCSDVSMDDLVISSVSSDEKQNSCGDGHFDDDVIIAEDGKSVDLRIERQGGFKANGRVYTVYIRATDSSGNSTTAPFLVHVPKHACCCAVDDGPAYTVEWGG